MADVQIHPLGDEPAPAGWVVPDTAELQLKGAYAKLDGSAAAGSYLPLLRIISDAGTVALEAVADTTVAAGASADASWFPHIASAPAAAPATTAAWAFMDSAFNQTVAANGGAGTKTTPIDMRASTFYTNDPSVFASSTVVISGTTYHGASITAKGHYELKVWTQPFWDGSHPAGGNNALHETNINGSFNAALLGDGVPAALQLSATIHDQLGLTLVAPFTVSSPPTGPLVYLVTNYTNTSWHHGITYWIEQLDSDTTNLL